MDKKSILQKGSLFLRNCFQEAMDHHYEEEIALAVAHQREKDVCCAIAAFFELKISETEIMRLLSQYYGVDSIAEATESMTTVKVDKKVNALRNYLNEQGMSRIEVGNYLREHRVRSQLNAERKLQSMSIDKLKLYFDKH